MTKKGIMTGKDAGIGLMNGVPEKAGMQDW
jgi:hypothetical protein